MMTSFIIQARLGSTRLPNKVLLPFFNEKNIITIIIEKLKRIPNSDIIMATTSCERDQPLVDIANKLNIKSFCGSENDVLKRFIDAAHHFDAKRIVRICSDNPFLDLESMKALVEASEKSECDYISFKVNGKPSIKTHFGFWAEYVTLEALEKVQATTNEALYHEHVTNFIYSHPNDYKIEWLNVPEALQGREDIRLTIDTQQDFIDAQDIYRHFGNEDTTIEKIINFVDENPYLLTKMKGEISQNSK